MDSPPCVSGPGVLQRSEVLGTISSARNPSDGSMACRFDERVDNDLLRPILGRYGYPFLSDMAQPFYPIRISLDVASSNDLILICFLWFYGFVSF